MQGKSVERSAGGGETSQNKSNDIKTNVVDLSKEHSFPYCVQSKGNSA